jgi:hypothetical protein
MTRSVDGDRAGTPLLLFFTNRTSGPARRMESLLAHLARKERLRLRVTEVPTLILVNDRRPVARLEGRASAPQIERLIAPHLVAKATGKAKQANAA